MKMITRNARLIIACLSVMLLSLIFFGAFTWISFGNRWFSSSANTYIKKIQKNIIPGDIYDRNSNLLAHSNKQGVRIYHSDLETRQSMVHALGDSKAYVPYGAESFMSNYLYGMKDSYFDRLSAAFKGLGRKGNDIRLSLDSNLSKYIHTLFPKNQSGAVIVMNYQTGEILALQSYPDFDPENITQSNLMDPMKPFWNRATKWVSAPGSTFKLITYASALQNLQDTKSLRFECSGCLSLGDSNISDAKKAVHGNISLFDALKVSCNISFAQLALRLGDQALHNTAIKFGIGDYYLFSDLVVENSRYPSQNRTPKEIARTGIGQSSLLISPINMCMVASSIANEGVMMEPKLLLQARDSFGHSKFEFEPKVYKQSLSVDDAKFLSNAMKAVVETGTGTAAKVSGLEICGKTGSSEISGQKETNSWFVGFINQEEIPYALCVVVEDSGSGGTVAAPIAGSIFRYLNSHLKQ